jgi:hypothetical protein
MMRLDPMVNILAGAVTSSAWRKRSIGSSIAALKGPRYETLVRAQT